MKKILLVGIVLICLLCVSGCNNSIKDQTTDAIDLCVEYSRESEENPTDEALATKALKACEAAQSLLTDYKDSSEYEDDYYEELKEKISELYD